MIKITHGDRPRNDVDDEEMMELAEKDFKTVVINMLKNFKENKNIMKREIEDKIMSKMEIQKIYNAVSEMKI